MERKVFVPIQRMRERAALARDDSDTSYFYDLLYTGELILKLQTLELLAGLQDDRDRHRYQLEYRLVRADGIGEWADVLDEVLTGPASQHLVVEARDSQRVLTAKQVPGSDTWQRRAVDQLGQVCLSLDPGREDVSRQRVALRQWVRDFAWLRNRTRGHGAPKAAKVAELCPQLLASLEEIANNAPFVGRPWAHLHQNLTGKFRVSGFGGEREPFEFLTREAGHSLANGTYVYLDRPRRVPLLSTDPELNDFFVPNGAFKRQTFEQLSYITDETILCDASGHLIPVEAQPESETKARPELDLVNEVFTNMPPCRDNYIQRPTLEEELGTVLKDARHPVVTLQGRGGIGKTSLALEVLHAVTSSDTVFAIVWFSARDIDLMSHGPKLVRPDVLSVDDMARDFAGLMGSEARGGPALAYLRDCLSGAAADGPFIFVVDNFETVRDQQALYTFLSNAVRLPNKVLITTRTRDFKADYPIEVRGLAREEYKRLVEDVAVRNDIRDIVTSAYQDELFEESDGHPYITKILLGEVARAGRRVALKGIAGSHEGLLDALFDRSYAGLTAAAQRVFLTLCGWRSLVPKVGLKAVLIRPGGEQIDVERAIDELEQSSMVEVHRDDSTSAIFLSVPLAAALFGKRRLVSSPLKIAVDADLDLIRRFGAATTTDLAQGLAPRVERATTAAARLSASGSDITQELAVIEFIAEEYPPAWLNLARLHREQGNSSLAVSSINRYLERVPDDADVWRDLVGLYRSRTEPLSEMHARLQVAELGGQALHELSSSASRLNGLLARREIDLNAEERRLLVRKFRSLMEGRAGEADSTDLSRLAWLCMHDQDTPNAEKWARQGLERDPDNEHCRGLLERISRSQ